MFFYNEPLYRPPAEAESVIVQATLGCSFNKCTFCTMYETKQYKKRPLTEVFTDIDAMAIFDNGATKLFLADGDALNLPTSQLVEIMDYAFLKFPKLRRISVYASAFNLYDKTLDELKLLKSKGLGLIYYGIESGSYEVLKKIQKPISNEKMLEGLNKASEAGLKTSVTVILGIAGKSYSKLHIKETAKIINQLNITYLSTLQLMIDKDREEKFMKNFDYNFDELSDKEMLEEQKDFLEQLNPKNKVIFRSNHASNTLALKGILPRDKNKLISQVEYVIKNYFN